MISQIVDPPSACGRRPRSWRRPSPLNSPAAMALHEEGAVGRLEPGLTEACKNGEPPSSSRCGATPTRRRAPRAFAEKREPSGAV